MKTADLIGPALDWAVAKSEGFEKTWSNKAEYNSWSHYRVKYSTDWSQGGPIEIPEELR